MAYSESLARRIRQQLAGLRGIADKQMFGGIGFLLDGNMCVGIWQDSLIARVGLERYQSALQEPFVGELDIPGRAMRGWVLIAPEGMENDAQLQNWVQCSLDFVRTLPAK